MKNVPITTSKEGGLTVMSNVPVASSKVSGLTVLSFGAGQDSTAILYRLVEDSKERMRWVKDNLIVVMASTGNEHPETEEHVKRTAVYCAEYGITFCYITPELGYHVQSWPTLEKHFEIYSQVQSLVGRRSCTAQLKVGPIYHYIDDWIQMNHNIKGGKKGRGMRAIKKFAEKNGRIRMLLGFAKDEEKRATASDKITESTPAWMRDCIKKEYPLIDWGWNRTKCQNYIRSLSKPVPLPSACMMCMYAGEQELLWLELRHPDVLKRWIVHERRKMKADKEKGVPDSKNKGVFGITVEEKLEKARKKYGHWTSKQLDDYKMSHGHCVASSY